MGRAASEWATRHRNVWAKGPAVLDVIERHLGGPRPVRRAETVWVPSWRTPCGLSEYTRHLADELPGVRVVAGWPDPRGCRVVHVQHESSLFRDAELTQALREYREAGVPYNSYFAAPACWHYRAFIMITSFPVSRLNPDINRRSRAAFEHVAKTAAEHGWGEYRSPPFGVDLVMNAYSFNNHALRRFCETLKDAVDPNGIIAAGRGGIWPKHLRGTRA